MAKMANLARNSLRAGENVNEITRGAPCIVEKLTKMEKLPDINGTSGENGEYGKSFAVGLVNIQTGYQKRPKESGENSQNLSAMVK